MELRVLRYFLEVARQGSFTAAAGALNLTQPTLSRQILGLEEELGTPLFTREGRRVALTGAGRYMAERAAEILELAQRAAASLRSAREEVRGEVHIAGGESRAMRLVARAMKRTQGRHPGVRFHIFSGNAAAVSERLEKGLADFGVFIRPASLEHYTSLPFPVEDDWGLLLRRDHPLARREHIRPPDIRGLPLICSGQARAVQEFAGWLGEDAGALDIVATYTLLFNAAVMVREGMGAAVCLAGIADTSAGSGLCFRPFLPAMRVGLDAAWKKQKVFSPAAAAFLENLKATLEEGKTP